MIEAETPLDELVDRALEKMASGQWRLVLDHPDSTNGTSAFGCDVPVEIARRAALAKPRARFPILGSRGATIDWQLVADHGQQAERNHSQSVRRLAERGGLSWCDMHAVLHNKAWERVDANDAMIACRALEARYLAALRPE